jgi:hypothetical protein
LAVAIAPADPAETPAAGGHDHCRIETLRLDLDPSDFFCGRPVHDRPCTCRRFNDAPIPDDVIRAWCSRCGGWLKGQAKPRRKPGPGRPKAAVCSRGHSLSTRRNGRRDCRICDRERKRRDSVNEPSESIALQGFREAGMVS